MAKCIMVQGTTSNAGKSFLCAALCRIFRQDGLRAAPFKSQNMALNSFITREGLEMGRAQVMQAEAAGIEPSVRMNPILLKPVSDVGSQLIVNGVPRGNWKARDYFAYKRELIPEILEAFPAMAEETRMACLFMCSNIHRDTQRWLGRQAAQERRRAGQGSGPETGERTYQARDVLAQIRQDLAHRWEVE